MERFYSLSLRRGWLTKFRLSNEAVLIEYKQTSCWTVTQERLLPACHHVASWFQVEEPKLSPTNRSNYWSGAAKCILVVIGFLPSEQKRISQPFSPCSTFSCLFLKEGVFLLQRRVSFTEKPFFQQWYSSKSFILDLLPNLQNSSNEIRQHMSKSCQYLWKCSIHTSCRILLLDGDDKPMQLAGLL